MHSLEKNSIKGNIHYIHYLQYTQVIVLDNKNYCCQLLLFKKTLLARLLVQCNFNNDFYWQQIVDPHNRMYIERFVCALCGWVGVCIIIAHCLLNRDQVLMFDQLSDSTEFNLYNLKPYVLIQ